MSPESPNTDRIYENLAQPSGGFVFDESVAEVFDDMIRRSVPGYAMTLSLMPLIAKRYGQENTNVYDLGCSLGAGMVAISKSLPDGVKLIGVDNSEAMLDRCRPNLAGGIQGVDWEARCSDILDTGITDASVVLLNFTLQFIPIERRLELLENIYNGLKPGGVLLLSEKIEFEEEFVQRELFELHHDFKRANGYSDLEISRKRTALEDVLKPETVADHKERLSNAGFSHSETWLQCFNFVSLLAIKQ